MVTRRCWRWRRWAGRGRGAGPGGQPAGCRCRPNSRASLYSGGWTDRAGQPVEAGAVEAAAAFEVGDAALRAGAPLDQPTEATALLAVSSFYQHQARHCVEAAEQLVFGQQADGAAGSLSCITSARTCRSRVGPSRCGRRASSPGCYRYGDAGDPGYLHRPARPAAVRRAARHRHPASERHWSCVTRTSPQPNATSRSPRGATTTMLGPSLVQVRPRAHHPGRR